MTWNWKKQRKVVRDGAVVAKFVKLQISLSDWQRIRLAAANEGICITDWCRREIEPAIVRLREQPST